MNHKRFTKIPIFKSESKCQLEDNNTSSHKIEQAIIFENDKNEKCLIIVYHKSNYEIIKVKSEDSDEIILLKGNILEIIKQSNSEIKHNKYKNDIFIIEYSNKSFIIYTIDDNHIHHIDLLAQKVLITIPFLLSNSLQIQHSRDLQSKHDHKQYQTERLSLLKQSLKILPLGGDYFALVQSRYQNYSFSQISIYNSEGQLVLRESVTGYRDKFDRGLFLARYLNTLNQIYLIQECIIDEQLKLLFIDFSEVQAIKHEKNDESQSHNDSYGLNSLQRYLKKQESKQYIKQQLTNKRFNHQVIDIQQLDYNQLVIFMNSNDRQQSLDPCYLLYNAESQSFLQEIIFDNFEEPIILQSVLSINQVNQSAIIKFISSFGTYTIEYNFDEKTILTTQYQESSLDNLNTLDSQGFLQNTLCTSSETSFYELDYDNQTIYQRYSVGISHSLLFLMQSTGVADYLSQISMHDVFQQLDLVRNKYDE